MPQDVRCKLRCTFSTIESAGISNSGRSGDRTHTEVSLHACQTRLDMCNNASGQTGRAGLCRLDEFVKYLLE